MDYMTQLALEQSYTDDRRSTVFLGVYLGVNRTGIEYDANFTWTDGSPWFDHDGYYWDVGQPSNQMRSTPMTMVWE